MVSYVLSASAFVSGGLVGLVLWLQWYGSLLAAFLPVEFGLLWHYRETLDLQKVRIAYRVQSGVAASWETFVLVTEWHALLEWEKWMRLGFALECAGLLLRA